jgi:hypothetical protein
MTFLLAILAFFAASVYFYYPLEERLLQPVQLAVFILLGILVILETFHVFRDRLLKDRTRKPEPTPAPAAPEADADRETLAEAQVLHFLGRLQEKGRLVDFVMDDIAPYSNEQVGAAARIVPSDRTAPASARSAWCVTASTPSVRISLAVASASSRERL